MIPKTSTSTPCNLVHLTKHHRDWPSSIILWKLYHPLLCARYHPKSELQYRLLKRLMSNSPSGWDNTIGQLLVESELGQANTQDDRTWRIASGNIVVDQGKYPSSTPSPEANWQIDYESEGVNTASDPSMLTQSSPYLRTVISLELSEANSNLEAITNKTDTSNYDISFMRDTTSICIQINRLWYQRLRHRLRATWCT